MHTFGDESTIPRSVPHHGMIMFAFNVVIVIMVKHSTGVDVWAAAGPGMGQLNTAIS